jgi:hypothetical protein
MTLSFESPVNRIYMGDGTGYSFALSKRASSTTTDLVTLTDGGNLSVGLTTTQGARFSVYGGALASGSSGLAFSSALTAGRLTTGDTNSVTGVINNYLDNSITELSAGSSPALTSGIVAFGGTAAVNPNTVKTYTAGTVRTTADVNGLSIVGGMYASYATGAGIAQLGTASGRAQYQYLTFGGTTGGTDYGWQIGRSSTAGIVADGFYIYDIKGSLTRLAIDLNGNVGIGTTTPTDTNSYSRALDIRGTSTSNGGVVYTSNSDATVRGFYGTFGASGSGSVNFGSTTSTELRFYVANSQKVTIDTSGNLGINETSPSTFGKLAVKDGTINLVTDTLTSRRLSFWSQANGNSENAYIQVANDGGTTNTGQIAFATRPPGGSLTTRATIEATGRLVATYGSYADPSLASSGSAGFNIITSATYNDSSSHFIVQAQNMMGVVHIRSGGVSSLPFYPNGGAGVAYGWTLLNPGNGTWAVGQGIAQSFTEFSSSPNSYTVTLNGGNGELTVQRTAGTNAYTVYIQYFANT